MNKIDSTPEYVSGVYTTMRAKLDVVRHRLERPLTLTEKLLLGHLDDPGAADLRPGDSYISLRPDRVAMQDATAQMALLQFAQAGIPTVAVPTTVHCDHLIRAYQGAAQDTRTALTDGSSPSPTIRTEPGGFFSGCSPPRNPSEFVCSSFDSKLALKPGSSS